ncbi:ABC transporter permease [Sphingobacterium puteale]|uniref:ABC transporter permease n=1 Tax=Sphingobacterium puteale TaxID=2420510 RepID=A0A420VTA2_9SPHI|nr:ABC transporter permease [Sphingobacterium puteale]RKO69586.1 ABC transporter permease [Sphingobacterium puteale]
MIKNYTKTAWRSIRANRFFSILNISGLAIGICVSLLLFAFIRQELSFDTMYSKADNIYRLHMQLSAEYNREKMINLPNAVGPALKSDIAQVDNMVRLVKDGFGATASIRAGMDNFSEKQLYLADSTLFSIFDFQFIEGNVHTAFSNKKSIVLSQSTKEKMFGSNEALGKLISINQRDTVQVTGVFKDLPANSTLDCNMVMNIMDSWMGQNVYWSNASYETYILLKKGSDPAMVAQQATKLIDKYVEKDHRYYTQFFLQPLLKVHLYSSNLGEGVTKRIGNIDTIRTLSVLAFLVIAIACINYMNLATAKSQKNAKEVGVNKVLGATRSQLIVRFFVETATISLFAMTLGVVLAILLIPLFNSIGNTNITIQQLLNWDMLGILALSWFMITFAAGSYPALFLSKIKSIALMNKGYNKQGKTVLIRQILVVCQFTISIILIIGISVMLTQMNFIRNKDLGYQPEHVVSVPIRSFRSLEKLNTLNQQVQSLSNTLSTTFAQSVPGSNESGKTTYKLVTDKQGLPTLSCVTYGNTVNTLGLKLLAGTDLPDIWGRPDSTCYVLINEKVLKYLGYKSPQEAIGKHIITEMSPTNSIITGVVQDFNYTNLKSEIGGYSYYTMNDPSESPRNLLIRYKTTDVQGYIDQIKKIYTTVAPEAAFDFSFLDQHVQRQYENEIRSSNIMSMFSFLTLFIACLGLLGLAAYTTEARSKEIGIRKVLGASVPGIIHLLSSNYIKLILLAFLIAGPIAYYLFNNWLNDFVYHIEMPWWAYLIAILIVTLVAFITIGFQTFKAALLNPVNSLRDE